MARRPKNPYATELAKLAKKIAKTRTERRYGPLSEAFGIVAAAGYVAGAKTLIAWLYGERTLPLSTDPIHGPSVVAVDGFCAAAGLPDVRKLDEPLESRVRRAELAARRSITRDNVPIPGPRPVSAWRDEPMTSPWRAINQWREAQKLAAPVSDAESPTEVIRARGDQ